MIQYTYSHITYIKDSKFKYYNQFKSASTILPYSISIQGTSQRYRISAPLVVLDRQTRRFITGLIRFFGDWHYGDLRNGDEKDFLLFLIQPWEIVVFHFPGFYPDSREAFIRQFIWDLKRPER
jgi:hypothetical protein